MADLVIDRRACGDTATMSSREIARLVDARHNDVVATIERLHGKGLLRSSRKTRKERTGGRPVDVYDLTERDTHLIVAGYSDEHRAKVIDRWIELEAKQANETNGVISLIPTPKTINQSTHEVTHENNRAASNRAKRALQTWIRKSRGGACRNVHNGATDARRTALSLRYGHFWSATYKGDFENGSKESRNTRQAQGKVSLLTVFGRLFSITRVTANSVTEFSRSDQKGAQRRVKRFFCAHSMVSCAWEAFWPAGVLSPGRLTRVQFATHCLVALVVNSKNRKEFHHV